MNFKILILCVAVVAVRAGYLHSGLRYDSPAIGFTAPVYHVAPAINYAAPAIARVEHLAPSVASIHKTEVYNAPIARTAIVSPATVHHVAASPLITAHAPVLRSGYTGYGFGYGVAPFNYGRSAW